MDRLHVLSEAALDRPEDPRSWLQLGTALADRGSIAAARLMAERAAAVAPTRVADWLGLGHLFEAVDRPKEALSALRSAARLGDSDAILRLAEAAGRLDQAAAVAAWIEGSTPPSPARAHALAVLAAARGRFAEAIAWLRPALEQPRPLVGSRQLLAELARGVEDPELELSALLALREVTRLRPEREIRMARLLLELDRRDEASTQLDSVLARPPPEPELRVELGEIALGLDRRREALEQARWAAEREPTAGPLLARCGQIAFSLERWPEAADRLAVAARTESAPPWVHLRLGQALLHLGRPDQAADALMRAASRAPEDVEIRRALGLALSLSNTTEAAGPNSLSGDLSVFRVEELLEFLGVQHASGILRVRSGGETAEVHLADGGIVEVVYPGRPRLLEALRLIAPPHVALEHVDSTPTPPKLDADHARLLLEADGVDRESLGLLLRARAEAGLYHLMGWQAGEARFEPSTSPHPAPVFAFGHRGLLMAVMTQLDEERMRVRRVHDRGAPTPASRAEVATTE